MTINPHFDVTLPSVTNYLGEFLQIFFGETQSDWLAIRLSHNYNFLFS